jgi:SPP1 gp7 family putative phage head morphogenesis protein
MPRATPSPLALRRASYADAWFANYRRALRAVLRHCVREAVQYVHVFGALDTDALIPRWADRLAREMERWLRVLSQAGYDLAGGEHKTGGRGNLHAKAETVTIGRRGRQDRADAFLLRQTFPGIREWVQQTSLASSRSLARRLEQIWADAIASRDPETGEAWTPREIADAILERGLAAQDSRAEMLARTGTIYAVNEGAMERYRDDGFSYLEWFVTEDDATCELCKLLDGKIVRIGDSFASVVDIARPFEVRHPPLHPNCRCVVLGVAAG